MNLRPEVQAFAEKGDHARRVEVIGIQLVGDLATPAPPPPVPDDYWLHARGCDCTYCTWERANGGDPLTQAAREWKDACGVKEVPRG